MIDKTARDIISPCLWGAAINSLDIEKDKFLIIERILEHGGDRQIDFIFTTYKRKDIINVIKESPYLSRRTVNYWCLFFDIGREDTRCYTKPYQNLWQPY
ncbi:MAG: hypothetical protein HY097_03400 [Nitrospinae bacterium]|nr:hypothetical protein [Nitrospinota bacterium]MBI3814280.1 hypothetical protein [Nitrospinota bacterium]